VILSVKVGTREKKQGTSAKRKQNGTKLALQSFGKMEKNRSLRRCEQAKEKY
jgi:hypothetical protein